MEKLIESALSFLEIMLLGAVAIGFISFYVIPFFHPIKKTLLTYYFDVNTFLFDDKKQETPAKRENEGSWFRDLRLLKVAIAFGAVYFAGAVANVVAYCFLEPAHSEVISTVQPRPNDPRKGVPDITNPSRRFLWLPLCPPMLFETEAEKERNSKAEKKHAEAIYLEMDWRNKNREGANLLLEPIIKRLRLLRGTVLFAALFGGVAIAKLFVGVLIWIFLVIWSRGKEPTQNWRTRAVNWVYENFIDHNRRFLEQDRISQGDAAKMGNSPGKSRHDFRAMRKISCKRAIGPNFVILLISISVYVVAMFAWRAAEIDFHTTVIAGQATALKAEPEPKK